MDAEDACAAARALVEQGVVRDASKIVVYGGSAGGLTVLASMLMEPQLFCCGVAYCPVSTFDTLDSVNAALNPMDASAIPFLIGADAARDPKLIRHRSPIARAAKYGEAHVMILHGSKDDVVPVKDSRDLVAAAQAAGARNVVLHELEGEGHMFSLPESWTRCLTLIAGLLRDRGLI